MNPIALRDRYLGQDIEQWFLELFTLVQTICLNESFV
jgi:hypothetical protein